MRKTFKWVTILITVIALLLPKVSASLTSPTKSLRVSEIRLTPAGKVKRVILEAHVGQNRYLIYLSGSGGITKLRGKALQFEFIMRADGRSFSISSSGPRPTYHKDSQGRLCKVRPSNSAPWLMFHYTAQGLIKEIGDNKGNSLKLYYNSKGELTRVETPKDLVYVHYILKAGKPLLKDISYQTGAYVTFRHDSGGKVTSILLGSMTVVYVHYNKTGKVSELGNSKVGYKRCEYDSKGNIVLAPTLNVSIPEWMPQGIPIVVDVD